MSSSETSETNILQMQNKKQFLAARISNASHVTMKNTSLCINMVKMPLPPFSPPALPPSLFRLEVQHVSHLLNLHPKS